MKLTEFTVDHQLDELLPAVAGIGGAVAKGAQAVGGAVAKGAQAMAGLAGGQMDPAQAAAAKKSHDEQKKSLQDQIKQTEQQLAELRKQLAAMG